REFDGAPRIGAEALESPRTAAEGVLDDLPPQAYHLGFFVHQRARLTVERTSLGQQDLDAESFIDPQGALVDRRHLVIRVHPLRRKRIAQPPVIGDARGHALPVALTRVTSVLPHVLRPAARIRVNIPASTIEKTHSAIARQHTPALHYIPCNCCSTSHTYYCGREADSPLLLRSND